MDKSLSLFAKAVLAGAGGLAVVAGPILWLFPEQTAVYFAWTIKHPLTPIFMGANYFGGIGAVWAILANRWSVARVLVPGIFVFAVTQLLATLLHIPIFNWAHPVAWAWLFVYLTSPVAAALVFVLGQRNYQPPAQARPWLPLVFNLGLLALATVSLVVGLGLILWPALVSSPNPAHVVAWWPWSLTALTARVLGGWYLAAAALQFTLARQRSIETARVGLFGLMVVTLLQVVGALRYAGAFDGPAVAAILYLLNAIGVFMFSALTWLFGAWARFLAKPNAA
jgi:hypothetical protein